MVNFLERLFGRRDEARPARSVPRDRRQQQRDRAGGGPARSADELAIERYRYLLRTAPPETIEDAHAEAFARLTPEQRRLVLQELSQALPARELAGGRANADDPRALARLATRAEARNPGALERTWERAGGIGVGGLMAGSFLSTIAGVVVGTAIADAFFGDAGYDQGYDDGAQDAEDAGADSDASDAEFDQFEADSGDFGDFGGDLGDFGGDFGGDF